MQSESKLSTSFDNRRLAKTKPIVQSRKRKLSPKLRCKPETKQQKQPARNLRKAKAARKIEVGLISPSRLLQSEEDFNSRKRWKTMNEKEVLECYFELDPEWTRKTIAYVKDLVHLSEKQIYKWGYERRRRLNLNSPDNKAVDMKLVTRVDQLESRILPHEFNLVVDSLFPEDEKDDEELSKGQKIIYDRVKSQLITRNEKYEQQSDLDKLLHEKVSVSQLVSHAISTVNRADGDRCCLKDPSLDNLNLKEVIGYGKENQNVTIHKIIKARDESLVWKENHALPPSQLSYVFKEFDESSSCQFDSVIEDIKRDGFDKILNEKESTHPEKYSESQSQIESAQTPLCCAEQESSIQRRNIFKPEGSLLTVKIENFPLMTPFDQLDEECKYDSLNSLCCSLLSSHSEFLIQDI